MSQPRVSVIVPTYNSERFVGRMIDSVRSQTFDDWELIIVDGNSADGTASRVESYQPALGDRLVFIEQRNQGCNAARNAGIEASRGAFVAFLDSDDEFLPTKLERQIELFERRPALGLVYSDFSYINLEGVRRRSTFDTMTPVAREVPYEEVSPGLCVCAPDLFEYLVRLPFIATIVGMVRREVLSDDIRFHVDNWYGVCEWLFYLEVADRCRAGFVNEPLCLNHFVPESISRTSRVRNSIDHRNLLRTVRGRFTDCSASAARVLSGHMACTCDQLGVHSYRKAEYGAALRYFAESMRERWTARTGLYLLQSACRWAAALGRPGQEPRLRFVMANERPGGGQR